MAACCLCVVAKLMVLVSFFFFCTLPIVAAPKGRHHCLWSTFRWRGGHHDPSATWRERPWREDDEEAGTHTSLFSSTLEWLCADFLLPVLSFLKAKSHNCGGGLSVLSLHTSTSWSIYTFLPPWSFLTSLQRLAWRWSQTRQSSLRSCAVCSPAKPKLTWLCVSSHRVAKEGLQRVLHWRRCLKTNVGWEARS